MNTNNINLAEQALGRLKDGNRRFFSQRMRQNIERLHDQRANTIKDQAPYAVIISCADSRVPPEHVFDAGIGDLFVIRVAGNVISNGQIGSVEYAIKELSTPLIIVMGHSGCGAVKATLSSLRNNEKLPSPYLQYLADKISNVLKQEAETVSNYNPEFINELALDDAIDLNIKQSIEQLSHRSLIVREEIKKGRLMVKGAYYDLESGLVNFED